MFAPRCGCLVAHCECREQVYGRDPNPLHRSCSLASRSIQKPIQPRPRRIAYRLDLPPSITSGRPANDRGLDQEVLGLSFTGRQFHIHRHHHSLCDRTVSRRSPARYRQIPEMPFPVESRTMIDKGIPGRNALPRSNGIVLGHLIPPVIALPWTASPLTIAGSF
jgi:hypothetical protein